MQDATKALIIDAHKKMYEAIGAVIKASDAAREDFAQQAPSSPTRNADYMCWRLIRGVEELLRNNEVSWTTNAAATYAGYEER